MESTCVVCTQVWINRIPCRIRVLSKTTTDDGNGALRRFVHEEKNQTWGTPDETLKFCKTELTGLKEAD